MSAAQDRWAHLSQNYRIFFDCEQVNLESHQLLWLDRKVTDINEVGIFTTFARFRQLVNYTKGFENWRECLKHIQNSNAITFLVCSGVFGELIVPGLQLSARKMWKVYIYCEDRQYHQEWVNEYDNKVYSVHTELKDLLDTIKRDVKVYRTHEKAGLFSELSRAPDYSTDEMNVSWWGNFIRVLISLPYPTDHHHRLVHELKKHGFTSSTLDEFPRDYSVTRNAVRWYSRSIYFFEILNRALRQRNIRLLLLFGSFLQDLHRQLKTTYETQQQTRTENPIVKVYRCQVISMDELRNLEIGFHVRNNSLFSASNDLRNALSFFGAPSSVPADMGHVIFVIETDYRHRTTAPFADISQLSFYPREGETLFMANTWLIVDSIEERNDIDPQGLSYWLVKLKLDPDYDGSSMRVLQDQTDRTTVYNCLSSLTNMLELVDTKEVTALFDELMNAYPQNAKWIRAVQLYCLGYRHGQCYDPEKQDNDYALALSYHEQALTIWEEYVPDVDFNCLYDIGENHFAIGQLYKTDLVDLNNLSNWHYEKALSFYERALAMTAKVGYKFKDILNKLVQVCETLAETAADLERGLKAVDYQREFIQLMLQEPVTCTEKDISIEYRNLAGIYLLIHRYDDALSCLTKALEAFLKWNITQTEDLSDYNYLIDLYNDIISICIDHKQDNNLALKYQLQQRDHKLKHLSTREAIIGDLNRDLNCTAENHFALPNTCINLPQHEAPDQYLTQRVEYSDRVREKPTEDSDADSCWKNKN